MLEHIIYNLTRGTHDESRLVEVDTVEVVVIQNPICWSWLTKSGSKKKRKKTETRVYKTARVVFAIDPRADVDFPPSSSSSYIHLPPPSPRSRHQDDFHFSTPRRSSAISVFLSRIRPVTGAKSTIKSSCQNHTRTRTYSHVSIQPARLRFSLFVCIIYYGTDFIQGSYPFTRYYNHVILWCTQNNK